MHESFMKPTILVHEPSYESLKRDLGDIIGRANRISEYCKENNIVRLPIEESLGFIIDYVNAARIKMDRIKI